MVTRLVDSHDAEVDHWRKILARYQLSKVSLAEFARREKVPYRRLLDWRKKLGNVAAESRPESPAEALFAEFLHPEKVVPSAASIEILMPGGVVIRGNRPATPMAFALADGAGGGAGFRFLEGLANDRAGVLRVG